MILKPSKIEELNKFTPVIFGHRGYKSSYPENTMISFNQAFLSGSPAIELDVMFSKDREVVVIHDETLDRTTSGKGEVKNFTLKELKCLDAGSWFESEFKGEKIPLLEEVFKSLGEKLLINVEIKPECYEDDPKSDTIEEKVAGLIEKYGLKERVIISSFNYRIIDRILKIDKDIKTAFILDSVPENFDEITQSGIFSVHPSIDLASKEFVSKLHNKGIMVFVWTVNQLKDFDLLIKNGVDGIFTDNPGLFLSK